MVISDFLSILASMMVSPESLSVLIAGIAIVVLTSLFPQALERLRATFFAGLRILLGIPPAKERPGPKPLYSERVSQLSASLIKASSEVDCILQEMVQVSQERATAISSLEQQLTELSEEEKELRAKIESLEKTPVPVADYFATLIEGGEKRERRRDYLLFGLGLVASFPISIIVAIVLHLIGL